MVSNLDAGERDAIALAHETNATLLILDDLPARRIATMVGLTVIGTAGVLYLAKQRGLVSTVRPLLDALLAKGFRLRQDVYQEILRAAGEAEGTP